MFKKVRLINAFAYGAFALSSLVAGQTGDTGIEVLPSRDSGQENAIHERVTKDDGLASFSKEFKLRQPRRIGKGQSTNDTGWKFAVTPYMFATGISGTVGARGRSLDVDANFFDVLKKTDAFAMARFDVQKRRLVLVNDFMWMKLSADADTRGGLYGTAKLGVNLLIDQPEGGYRFVESDRGSLDVLGGVRIWSLEANLNTTSGLLTGFDVSQRKTWAAPVVGLRGTGNVTPKFFVDGKFDIGGAGIGADLTTQFYGGAGYRLFKNFAVAGGYRWLQVDYDDDNGFLFDTRMDGLQFGAKFNF